MSAGSGSSEVKSQRASATGRAVFLFIRMAVTAAMV